jgi:hypothetical protein
MSPRLGALLFALLLVHGAALGDSRQRLTPGSPTILRAVGHLEVPGLRRVDGRRSHYTETCSATLIADGDAAVAQAVLTAWHCLEYYEDLSRDIVFSLARPGAALRRTARHIGSGGGMHADWALLRLDAPVPVDRYPAASLAPAAAAEGTLIMAGFSRDAGLGSGGDRLTWDGDCRIRGRHGSDLMTDCVAYRGASGGGVFQDGRLIGVVSRGDSRGRSIFVPVERFRSRVLAQLR